MGSEHGRRVSEGVMNKLSPEARRERARTAAEAANRPAVLIQRLERRRGELTVEDRAALFRLAAGEES